MLLVKLLALLHHCIFVEFSNFQNSQQIFKLLRLTKKDRFGAKPAMLILMQGKSYIQARAKQASQRSAAGIASSQSPKAQLQIASLKLRVNFSMMSSTHHPKHYPQLRNGWSHRNVIQLYGFVRKSCRNKSALQNASRVTPAAPFAKNALSPQMFSILKYQPCSIFW